MTDETPPTPVPVRKPLARRIALWIAGTLATLLVLLVIVVFGLDTGPGHRFLADAISRYTTQSGISIHPGRIEGSIYSRMTILDLEVRDPKGAFLTVPRLDIDWHPFAYAHKLIDVRSALADTATLLRSPRLNPTPPPPPDQPLLPDIDLALGQLRVGRLTIEPAVDGKRHVLGIAGSAALAQGRAQIDATVRAVAGPGLAGGDNFRLRLDAVPAENRLLVDLNLDAPAGGMVDSYAHLGKSLALRMDGHGDWANWHGALTATAGGNVLADMALTGANGHFQVHGRSLPSAILAEGAATRLTAPELDLAGSVVLGQRRADVDLTAHSAAFAVSAQGLIDLATNSLGGFHVTGRLSNPGAITPDVSGRDVRLDAVLDGPMATPSIDYRLSAAAFGFKTMAIEGLEAHGKATIDAMHILVPVDATARRVAGLDAAAGGLLTNLSTNGTVAYSGGKLLTDNLALKSDRLNVTVIAIADLAHGQYTGAIKGRINDYHVQGLGRIALEADAHLVPARNGGFGIAGWVRAQTRQIDNASVASFLGGNALLSANIGYSADNVASLSNLRVTAPGLHIENGDGRYMSDGRILFRTAGTSGQYGPFAIDAMGTAARPVVHLHADRPDVGVQLANVDARLTGDGRGGYDVTASGGSAYGPFAGNVAITTAQGPLRIGIKTAQFAGIHFAGALTRTTQGPFAGTVTAQGSGLDGRIRLAAAGTVQRADIAATASAAKVPGSAGITIGAGTIHAGILLTPGAPEITGDARLTDIRQGQLLVTSAQARVNYRQGHGTVALVTSGHDSVPFNLAAQAALAPDRIVFNAKGSANAIAFNLTAPAVLTKAGADWQLGQATIQLPHGQVVLTGRYGARSEVHAQVVNLDLSIIQAVAPRLLLGGKATGTIDVALPGGNALPVSHIRLDVAGFTRTGAMTVSDPLDLAFQATSGGDSAHLAALIRQRGAIVGRAQVQLNAGGGGAWTDRLMHAGLSGGIRYSGPSELLWTLTGIAGQDVSGPVALAADFSGRTDRPAINGVIRANQLRYENDAYGTVINTIAIDGRFTQSQFVLNSMTGKAGDGTLSAKGSVSLDAAAGYPINLSVQLANARLAKSDALGASVSGTIAVTNSKGAGGLIQGDIALGEVRYQIIRQGAAEVPELTGVHRKGQPLQAAGASDQGPAPSQWKLAMHVHAPGRIFVSGMGLEAEWSTDMRISGTAGAPSVVGELDVVRGTYSFAGKDLDLDNTSKVTFDGGSLLNPLLSITASTTVTSVTATIAITGRAQQPQIAFTSTPTLPQDEVLSRLLFGTDVTSLSPIEAVQLAAALNSLRGSGGGFSPLGKIRSVAGFDRLRVVGANPQTGQGTSLAAGKYIARNVYVEIVTDTRGFTATQLEVALSKAFSVLSSTGTFGGSNAGVRYRRDH
jgi:translocation and assembly module TamB